MKSSYLKNFTKVASGSAGAQIVFLLSTPVISRVYTPHDFGVFSLMSTIVSIASVFFTLRYNQAIQIAKNNREATLLIYISIILSLLWLIVFSLIVWLFDGFLFNYFSLQNHQYVYLYLLPVMALFLSYIEVLRTSLLKFKQFGLLGFYEVVLAFVSSSAKVFVGVIYGSNFVFLIVGSLLGNIFILYKTIAKFKNSFSNYQANISLKRMITISFRYKDFPLYAVPNGIFGKASIVMPLLVFGVFFSAEIVGQFAMAYSLVRLPVGVIGSSLTKVYIQEISNISYKERKKLFLKNTFYLSALGTFVASIIYFSGESIFVTVLGSEWTLSGHFAEILIFWAMVWLVSTIWTGTMVFLRKQDFLLKYQIIGFILKLLSLLPFVLNQSVVEAVVAYVLTSSLLLLYLGVKAFVAIKENEIRRYHL